MASGPPIYRGAIEGYTNPASVVPGEQIAFHISSDIPRYSIEIARIGADRQVVWLKQNLTGQSYPAAENASTHGCNWPAALKLTVAGDWPSGYYSAVMRGKSTGGSTVSGEMSFLVRSCRPGHDARILLQRATNTDNAYNSWGGCTLYNGPNGPARQVSFDRPFAGFWQNGPHFFDIDADCGQSLDQRNFSLQLQDAFAQHGIPLPPVCTIYVEKPGRLWYLFMPSVTYAIKRHADHLGVYDGFSEWANCWSRWELPFVAWAERAGYKIDYAANSDLEFHPEILNGYRLVLSVGHDEYWSYPMRDHLEAYVADGGNVAFFSGNTMWWQVRLENAGRTIVCYKDYRQDPFYPSGNQRLLSTLTCHRLINHPENRLTGVSFAYGGYHDFFDCHNDGPWSYTVDRPSHWVFQNTGLKRNDQLGARDKIVGYECDGCDFEMRDGLPVPTGRDGTPENFEILATAPAKLPNADSSLDMVQEALYGTDTDKRHCPTGAAVLGTYQRGGTVFTTGCTNWSYGLRGGDEAVMQITRNILDRLSQ